MRRPKGNDVRRARFDGPAELAPSFRDGRLETSLRRYLVDAGLVHRERNVYRRA